MNRHPYRSFRPYKYHGFLHSDFAHLLLFYILPFVTVNSLIFFLATTRPKYELVVEGTNDYRTTDITFTIKSVMPLKEVTIKMDSEPLDLEKVGKKKYRATITHNGSLEIYMKNFNDMALLEYEYIDILDNESPMIEDAVSEEGILSFTVSDTQSGVDFSSICAITSTGEQILPLSADRATGRVSFQMDLNGLVVQVKDMTGNEFQTTFSLNPSETYAAPESGAAEGA